MVRKIVLVASIAAVAVFSSQCGNGGGGGTGGGSGTGGSSGGGSANGGGTHTGGGSSGGGSAGGGSSGGGSAGGGSAGGGSAGGGSAGGGSAGGGSAAMTCAINMPDTCATGTECLINNAQNPQNGQCFPGACNVVNQDCGTDMKCTYVSNGGTGARGCVASTGGDAIGTVCGDGGMDNCVAGSICVGSVGTGASTCKAFCQPGVTGTCADGTACNEIVTIPGLSEIPAVCAPISAACSLFAQDCTNNQACLPSGGGGTTCFAAGTTAVNAMCDPQTVTSDVCVKGALCVGSSATMGTCEAICNLDGGSPTCATGTCADVSIDTANAGACGT